MAIYRNLFFNNLRSLLSKTFPVIRKIHSDEHWDRFIRQFMQNHQAKTPYFLELPEEFLNFLGNGYEHQALRLHQAGHLVEAEDLRIDTHGNSVDDQSWELLAEAYEIFGPVPTLLERDFNFPPMAELLDEVRRIKLVQAEARKAVAANG